MVKIRLTLRGCKKHPCYHVVVTDSRNARDGNFIERIGFFKSFNNKENIYINMNRVNFWIKNGAQVSTRIKYLIKKFSKDYISNEKYKI